MMVLVLALIACTVHAKGPGMFEGPVMDRVLKVGGFYSTNDGVVVQFTDLPQQCTLSLNAPDFAKSVTSVAEGFRKNQPVHVKVRGAGEILSVSGP
jgi:hypothetical protein